MKKIVSLAVLCAFSFANGAFAAGLAPEDFDKMYSLAHNGEVYALRGSVQRGLNIDSLDRYGNTGLCVSIYRKDQRAYNTFRAAGANPRHPCTQNIPPEQYRSFMSSPRVVAVNETPRMAYNVIHSGFLYSAKFWTTALLSTAVIAAMALSGGGGGGSEAAGESIPTLKGDKSLAIVSGTKKLDPVVDEETGVSTPQKLVGKYFTKGDYEITEPIDGYTAPATLVTLLTNGYSIMEKPLSSAQNFATPFKATEGAQIINSVVSDVTAGIIGMVAQGYYVEEIEEENTTTDEDGNEIIEKTYKKVSIPTNLNNSARVNVSGTNAAIGIVAGNYAEATNNGDINLTMEADGKNSKNSVVGMYADTGAYIYNTSNITSEENGASGKGTVIVMMLSFVSSLTDLPPDKDESRKELKAVNSGKISFKSNTSNSHSFIGMGSFTTGVGGSIGKAILNNTGTISMSFTPFNADGLEGEVKLVGGQGFSGGIGMRADANTTATNAAGAYISLVGGNNTAAGMVAVNGGTIQNNGTITVGDKSDSSKTTKGYALASIRGKTNTASTLINNSIINLYYGESSAVYIDTDTNISMGTNSKIYLNDAGQSVIYNGREDGTALGDKENEITVNGTVEFDGANAGESTSKNMYVFKGKFGDVEIEKDAKITFKNNAAGAFLYELENMGMLKNYGTVNWGSALSTSFKRKYLFDANEFENHGSLTFSSILKYSDPNSSSDDGLSPIEYIIYGEDVEKYSLDGLIQVTNSSTTSSGVYIKNQSSLKDNSEITNNGGISLSIVGTGTALKTENVGKVTNSGDLKAQTSGISSSCFNELTNSGQISDFTYYGIIATDGDSLTNSGKLMSAPNQATEYVSLSIGIYANNVAQIINKATGTISVAKNNGSGIFASSFNSLTNQAAINAIIKGISATGLSITTATVENTGNITVTGDSGIGISFVTGNKLTNTGNINSTSLGINTYNVGAIESSGDITLNNSSAKYGIYAANLSGSSKISGKITVNNQTDSTASSISGAAAGIYLAGSGDVTLGGETANQQTITLKSNYKKSDNTWATVQEGIRISGLSGTNNYTVYVNVQNYITGTYYDYATKVIGLNVNTSSASKTFINNGQLDVKGYSSDVSGIQVSLAEKFENYGNITVFGLDTSYSGIYGIYSNGSTQNIINGGNITAQDAAFNDKAYTGKLSYGIYVAQTEGTNVNITNSGAISKAIIGINYSGNGGSITTSEKSSINVSSIDENNGLAVGILAGAYFNGNLIQATLANTTYGADITVKNAGGITVNRINTQKAAYGIYNNRGDVTNSGKITIEDKHSSSSSNPVYNYGIYLSTYGNVTNATGGEIEIKQTKTGVNSYGIYNYKGNVTNDGKITITDTTNSWGIENVGICLNTYGSITNSGTITFDKITNKNYGIYVEDSLEQGDVKISNNETIENAGIGILVALEQYQNILTINNDGKISANTYGISAGSRDDFTSKSLIKNAGIISVSDQNSTGIYSDNIKVTNNGNITASGYGIKFIIDKEMGQDVETTDQSPFNLVTNTGTIKAGTGIWFSADSGPDQTFLGITNSGTINAGKYGIYVIESAGPKSTLFITNSGTIQLSHTNRTKNYLIYNESGFAHITNIGKLILETNGADKKTDSFDVAIYSNGSDATITNGTKGQDSNTTDSDYIKVTDDRTVNYNNTKEQGGNVGIYSAGNNAKITNYGRIDVGNADYNTKNTGIYSAGSNATVTNEGLIKVLGKNSIGIYFSTGGNVTNEGTIDVAASNAKGVFEYYQGDTNIYSITSSNGNGKINVSKGYGLYHVNNGKGHTINVTGASSKAFYEDGFDKNDAAIGMRSAGNYDYKNDGTISVSGSKSMGTYNDNGGTTTNNGTISVSGGGIGMAVKNSNATNSGTITVDSNSYGMYAASGATIKNNGTITVLGSNSYGMYAASGATIKNNGTIKISGITSLNTKACNQSNCGNVEALAQQASLQMPLAAALAAAVNFDESEIGLALVQDDEQDISPVSESASIENAIRIDENSTFINNGLLLTNEDINFDNLTSAQGASFEVTSTSAITGTSFAGDVVANSEIVTSDENLREYSTENSFIGENNGLNILSGSYMFGAAAQDGESGIGIVMSMRDFNDIMDDKALGSYLSKNYDLGNRVSMYNRMKAASNKAQYDKIVNDELGLDFVPSLTKQNLEFNRDFSAQLNDEIFENLRNNRKDFISGIQYYHHRNSSYRELEGYDTNGSNLYSLYNEDFSSNASFGFGMSLGTNTSKFDDDSSSYQAIAQAFVPVAFSSDDMTFVSMPQFGAGFGRYKRKVEGDKTHKADLSFYSYGVSNQLRKDFEYEGMSIEPVAEFNVLGLYTGQIKEKDNMFVKSQNAVSIEGGLGLYLGKSIELANSATLKFRAGGTYYREMNNPYQRISAGFTDADGFYNMRGYDNSRDRGVVSLKADYGWKQFNFYVKASEYIERNSNFSLQGGINYKF